MKIRALRLRDVGPFRDGVAVESFSGGLELLSGPNELGKSTLLAGLNLVFHELHTAGKSKASITALGSDGRGQPLVECEFDLDGQRWRITKQYLSGRSAMLVRIGDGATWRGPEAEQQLASLIGTPADRMSFRETLWVGQGAGFEPPRAADDARTTLRVLAEAAIEEAVGGGLLDEVRRRMASELDGLVTGRRGNPRKGGAWYEAIERHKELQSRHDLLQERARAAEADAAAFARLRLRQAELADPAVVARLEQDLAAAEAAHMEARQAADRHGKAKSLLEVKSKAFDLAEERRRQLGDAAADLDRLVAHQRGMAAELEQSRAALAAAEADLKRAESERETTAGQLAAMGRRIDELRRRRQHREAARALAAIERDADEAERLSGEIADLATGLGDIGASPAGVGAARRLAADIGAMEAALAAAAPRVVVRYVEGAAGRFTVDGKPIADGAALTVEERVAIEVPGIGAIEIAPGGESGVAERRLRLGRARASLSEALARMGVGDMDEAETALGTRMEIEAGLARCRERLAVIAREGIDELAARKRELAAQVRSLSAGAELAPGAEPGALRAALEQAQRDEHAATDALTRADAALNEARAAHGARSDTLASLAARAEERSRQIVALRDKLGDDDELAGKLRNADAALAAARVELNEAERQVSIWSEAAPDDRRLDELAASLARAGQALRDNRTELVEVRREMAQITGRLSRDDEDGTLSRAGEAAEELALAADAVQRWTREVESLSLLLELIDGERRQRHARLDAPVMARLQSYARAVFGEASFALGDALGVTEFSRAGRNERLEWLSGGTREQISVIARLALARLLAEQGAALPVILDDALVYADDRRLAAMFAVLEEAARHHQVIVLSCHEETFAPLVRRHGATRLVVKPWSPDSAVRRAG